METGQQIRYASLLEDMGSDPSFFPGDHMERWRYGRWRLGSLASCIGEHHRFQN